jgi:hypothetical protein
VRANRSRNRPVALGIQAPLPPDAAATNIARLRFKDIGFVIDLSGVTFQLNQFAA